MAKKSTAVGQHLLTWSRFRGRNGVDEPSVLPADQGTEAINWVITAQGLGERRRGTRKLPLTGTFAGAASMTRYQPTQNDGMAQLVFNTFDAPSQFLHVSSGLNAVPITQADQLVGSPLLTAYATGNGKLFIAYKSTAGNRLHIYDPARQGNQLVLAGIGSGPTVNVANIGTGTYPAVLRYYRGQSRAYVNGVSSAVSGLGPALAMTPTGTGAAVQVGVFPATEKETQWRVFASADDVLYYQLNDWTDFATSVTWNDSRLVSTYASLPVAPLEGSRYPLPSAKYLLWDGVRLLLFGTYGDTANNALPAVPGRVYFTQALDATVDGGEDEAIVMTQEIKSYIDCNRSGGAEDRAIVGPVDGAILVLQSRGVYLLKPTGAVNQPYQRIVLSKEIGAVSHWSSFVGEDEAGAPCIYWLDPHRGPYRYGRAGLQWIGYDVQDLWATYDPPLDTVMVAHGLYDQRTRRCYWWLTRGPANYPDTCLCFHVKEGRGTQSEGVRYGWTQFSGKAASSFCSVIFAEQFGNPMGRRLKPYLGYVDLIVQFDAEDTNLDHADTGQDALYVAVVRSKAWNMHVAPQIVQLDKAWVRAHTTNAILAQRLLRNYGDQEEIFSTVPLAPQGSESRRIFLFEDAQLAGAWTFQTELGDAIAEDHFYSLDRWDARVTATDLEVGSSEL
jgi:hypothetical protein